LILGTLLFPLRSRAAFRAGLAAAAAAAILAVPLEPAVRPDLVLVTVDALRADRINDSGFAELAPNVQRFAEGAVRFTHAWATAPWTIPAMSSIFTGIHPSAHGARFCNDAAGAAPPSRWLFAEGSPLAPNPLFTVMTNGVETLPQALSRGGYLTGGFSDWFFISPGTGFARGFDRFVLTEHDHDGLVVEEALRWFRQARGSRLQPVFLFVHLFGPHQPYEPSPDDLKPGYRYEGPLPATCFDIWDSQLDGEQLAQRIMARGESLPPDVLTHIRALYDGEVRAVDRNVGRLLAAVDGICLSGEETMVVLSADHGEFLGGKNLLDHGHYVYDPVLRVPLIVRFPRSSRVPRHVVPTDVSPVDIYPTLLGAAGVSPDDPLTSEDLRGAVKASSPGRRLAAENNVNLAMCLLFGDRFRHTFDVVIEGRWKLILTDGRSPELYDIEADPGESTDRSADDPRRVADLRTWLDGFRHREIVYPPAGRPSLTPDDVRQLRSLGYVR
jgi:arylsulfatase A-like enzyme